MSILYVCNQQKDCNASLFCGDECTHTADINYAKNFTHEEIAMSGDATFHMYTERINNDENKT